MLGSWGGRKRGTLCPGRLSKSLHPTQLTPSSAPLPGLSQRGRSGVRRGLGCAPPNLRAPQALDVLREAVSLLWGTCEAKPGRSSDSAYNSECGRRAPGGRRAAQAGVTETAGSGSHTVTATAEEVPPGSARREEARRAAASPGPPLAGRCRRGGEGWHPDGEEGLGGVPLCAASPSHSHGPPSASSASPRPPLLCAGWAGGQEGAACPEGDAGGEGQPFAPSLGYPINGSLLHAGDTADSGPCAQKLQSLSGTEDGRLDGDVRPKGPFLEAATALSP